jgi:hypothetical protein
MPKAIVRANDTVLPIVIETIGDQGQRVEHGFIWPEASETADLINSYRALMRAEETLARSRRRVAGEAKAVREMLNLS